MGGSTNIKNGNRKLNYIIKSALSCFLKTKDLMQLEYFAVIQYMRISFLGMGAECKYIAMDFSLC